LRDLLSGIAFARSCLSLSSRARPLLADEGPAVFFPLSFSFLCLFLSFVFFFPLSFSFLCLFLSFVFFFTLSFSFLCFFLYVVIPNRVVCGRLEGPAVFSPLSLFFTLSSRTASCADALRDLLFGSAFCRHHRHRPVFRSHRRHFGSFRRPRLLLHPFPLRPVAKSLPT
jgi:hypothetical protein